MGPEMILELESLDQHEEVHRADERLSKLQQTFRETERQLDDAWAELAPLENEDPGPPRGFYYKRLSEARQAVAEAESNLRVAAELLEEGKEERREICDRIWLQIESVLVKERRRRVKEAIPIIAQAIQANRRINEIERKCEELLPSGPPLRGGLVFDACPQELNDERLDDWLDFLKLCGIVDESEMAVSRSIGEAKWSTAETTRPTLGTGVRVARTGQQRTTQAL